MVKMEQLEMDAHRAQLNGDMEDLVEKYRCIFGWDVPELDEELSDRLIFEAIKKALAAIEAKSAKGEEG